MCEITEKPTESDLPTKALSIIIPIQFYRKVKKTYSRNLFFSLFYKRMKEHIKCDREDLKWVEVSTQTGEDNSDQDDHISYSEAFENEDNLEAEKEYFCREFFDSLYDYDKKKSCHRILMLKSTSKSEAPVDLSDLEISIYFDEDESNLKIRKVYLMTYTSFNALLVVELAYKEDANHKVIKAPQEIKNSLLHKKISLGNGDEKKEFEKYLMGSKFSHDDEENAEILYFRSFKHNRFVAEFDQRYIEDPRTNEITVESMGHYVANKSDDFKDFFSYYFQMYLNNIYVKTELLNISMLASGLASSWFFRSTRVTHLLKEYILFINKHCQAECTYNETGQKTFEYMKEQMQIKRINDYVNEQISAFNEHSNSRTGAIIAFWGVVFAVAQVVVAIISMCFVNN